MNKQASRLRRAGRGRHHIRRLKATRLCVNRTLNHIYAQVISPCGSKVLAAASSLDKSLKSDLASTGNTTAAVAVGKLVAERALAAGVKQVAFDRSGNQYHGRIKALADAAREQGLEF